MDGDVRARLQAIKDSMKNPSPMAVDRDSRLAIAELAGVVESLLEEAPADKLTGPIGTRWREIDSHGNVATEPTPDHPEEHDEGETGPPETSA